MPNEDEARNLARENAMDMATIVKTLWFPNSNEFRLVHIDTTTLPSDGILRTFWFGADPAEGIQYPSRVAFALPEEVDHLALPEGWGSWDDAIPVYQRQQAA